MTSIAVALLILCDHLALRSVTRMTRPGKMKPMLVHPIEPTWRKGMGRGRAESACQGGGWGHGGVERSVEQSHGHAQSMHRANSAPNQIPTPLGRNLPIMGMGHAAARCSLGT